MIYTYKSYIHTGFKWVRGLKVSNNLTTESTFGAHSSLVEFRLFLRDNVIQ